MKVALFGATGETGRATLALMLAKGWEVSALARDPSKLSEQPGLTIHKGDIADPAAIASTLAGADVLVSCLGNFNRKPNTELSDGSANILKAARAAGVNRSIWVTSIGCGDSWARMTSPVFKYFVIKVVAKAIWADKDRQENLIRADGMGWTIVRPGSLKNEHATGNYVIDEGAGKLPKQMPIPRGDVADFLVRAVQEPQWQGRTVQLFTRLSA